MTGWDQALRLGALAFAVVGLLGQAMAFFLYAADQVSDAPTISVINAMRIGGLYFFGFHHVGISFTGDISGVEQGRFGVGVAAALLLVTAFALVVLYRFGRRVAATAGGGTVARALHGAKTGVPYGLLSLLLSFIVPFPVPGGPGGPNHVDIGVGHAGAFLLPFLLGVVAGALGGLSSLRSELEGRDPWGRRVLAAAAGGLRAFLAALAFAFVGLLVLAAAKPDATRAYVDGVTSGVSGAFGLTQHVLALPNQSMWVLVPAMGGCDGIYGGTGPVSANVDFLCYGHFPKARGSTPIEPGASLVAGSEGLPQLPFGFGTAPVAYFLFLLVPALAVLLGGAIAAKRSGASTSGDGAAAGALAGVVFGGLVSVGAWLGGVGASVSGGAFGFGVRVSGTIGPRIGPSILLGLAWGIVGGVIGGWLRAARSV